MNIGDYKFKVQCFLIICMSNEIISDKANMCVYTLYAEYKFIHWQKNENMSWAIKKCFEQQQNTIENSMDFLM